MYSFDISEIFNIPSLFSGTDLSAYSGAYHTGHCHNAESYRKTFPPGQLPDKILLTLKDETSEITDWLVLTNSCISDASNSLVQFTIHFVN